MDEELKEKFEKVLSEIGLNMTSAFTVFAKTVARRGEIPFRLEANFFLSKNHQIELERRAKNLGQRENCIIKTIDELEALENA
jgi:DNA-damage-inducible protein J